MDVAVAQQLAAERLGYVLAAEGVGNGIDQRVVVAPVSPIERSRFDVGGSGVLGILEAVDLADLMQLAVVDLLRAKRLRLPSRSRR
jgi:hypothetical protein